MGVAEVVGSAAPLPRWRAWALAGALAVAPDLDFALGIALERGAAYHGTFTHSIVATLVVAGLFLPFGIRWGVLAGSSFGSHLLVDLLDDRGRTNVLLGWPLTSERPLAIARIFPQVPFYHGGGLREALLSLLRPDVVEAILLQTAVGFCFFLLLFAISRIVRLLRPKA